MPEEHENNQRHVVVRPELYASPIRIGRWVAAVVGLVVVVLLISFLVSGFGYAPIGYYSLVYRTFPSNQFIRVVQPGQGVYWRGYFTTDYQYPATQRTYIVSANPDEGDVQGQDIITAKCGDSNSVNIQTALTFNLVSDPDKLREFHEKIGLKRSIWTTDGWQSFLEQYIRQPEKDAFQRAVKPYTAITASGETTDAAGHSYGMNEIGSSVGEELQRDMDNYMGGHYVQVVQFQLNDITPEDSNIVSAIAARTAAQQSVQTAQQQLAAAQYQAQANKERAASLESKGGMAAVLDDAVKSGKVTFWVLNGQNLTVAGPQQ
jgi:hypothetical protein